ncbi:MAG TPA: VanZ family protein [Thermoanaerobaculia bacterium]|jgi:VanZ family protein|nr:VanZ family protein [Thermoanaerobaculia bacterium]
MKLLSLRRARILTAVWAVFMLALTSWPSPPEVPVVSSIPNFDKFVHSVLYGVLGFLASFAIAWPAGKRRPLMRALFVAGAIAVWGTLDEIHQAWIPGRSMELGDAVADTSAGFVGALAAGLVVSRRPALSSLESEAST